MLPGRHPPDPPLPRASPPDDAPSRLRMCGLTAPIASLITLSDVILATWRHFKAVPLSDTRPLPGRCPPRLGTGCPICALHGVSPVSTEPPSPPPVPISRT